MILESGRRIKNLVSSVSGAVKYLNLKSAVRALIDSYEPETAGGYTSPAVQSSSGSVQLESGAGLAAILDEANTRTGCADATITEAMQRLLDGNNSASDMPLYSFGVLADLHMQYETGASDLQRALSWMKDNVDFTCIVGDLVAWAGVGTVEAYGTTDYMAQYKACVDAYAGDMPVYECAGNHETYPEHGVSGEIDESLWMQTTGKQLYYSFEYGDDVFLFLSLKGTNVNDLFADGGLAWLETNLEANKNKRCFVFQHCPELADRAADPSGTWSSLMEGESGKAFVALMKRYPNTVWFHGHTHVTFGVEQPPVSDVEILGYRSVHVPSLVSPRFYDAETNSLVDYYYDGPNKVWGSSLSEGYVVNVYQNRIVLIGMDFAINTANGLMVLPITGETYGLDTTLKEV